MTVAAIDAWQPAIETFSANLGEAGRQAEISASVALPKAKVVVGGPPCQGFSSAGMRRRNDQRNTLVSVFSRIVASARPIAFVFENVEGFLTGADGHFVLDLLGPVLEAGYRVHLRKINAANFGVPQHRKRVVAIGGLGWDPPFPDPTHRAFGAPGAQLASLGSLPSAPSVLDALEGLPAARESRRSDGRDDALDHSFAPMKQEDLDRASMLGPGQRMRDLPQELWHDSYRKRAFRRVMDGTPTEKRGGAPAGVRRLHPDEPSKAITGGAIRDFLHPVEDRPLTIRECARLQTFPDDFRFVGRKADRLQLIGNAVPPLLAERIGEVLAESMPSRRPARPKGALLSFVPTLSTGMSPALQRVCRRVAHTFAGTARLQEEQAELWR